MLTRLLSQLSPHRQRPLYNSRTAPELSRAFFIGTVFHEKGAFFLEQKTITSRKNPIIREAANLLNSAQKRREEGLFLVEGARLTLDAAGSGTGIFRLFYTASALQKYPDYLNPAKAAAKECYLIEEHVAALLSSTKGSQGIFCLCQMGKERDAAEIKGKILVLENIQDPSNLGSVFRTGEALGIAGFLLVGDCCDPFSPKVLRASMGGVFRLKLYRMAEISPALELLHGMGYESFSAVPDSTAEKLTDITFPENSAVCIGNEGNGLTAAAKALCRRRVTIPMGGRAESLNAGTAAAIILWEMVR